MKKYDKNIVEYAKSIKFAFKESNPEKEILSSPEEFQKFLEKENIAKSGILSQIRKINKIADDVASGKREIQIDIDKLPSDKKRIAQSIISTIKVTVAKKNNPTFGPTYQAVSQLVYLLLSLLTLGAIIFMGPNDGTNKIKKREFVKTVKRIGNPNKKTPNEILSWVKNIVSLFE
jgi:hypothetical protein